MDFYYKISDSNHKNDLNIFETPDVPWFWSWLQIKMKKSYMDDFDLVTKCDILNKILNYRNIA